MSPILDVRCRCGCREPYHEISVIERIDHLLESGNAFVCRKITGRKLVCDQRLEPICDVFLDRLELATKRALLSVAGESCHDDT